MLHLLLRTSFRVLVALLLAHCCAFADDNWVGKEVIPKRGASSLHRLEGEGQALLIGNICYWPAKVLEDKGESVKIMMRDKVDWIDKDKLVTVDEGISYFTKRIQARDYLAEAYDRRAWLWSMKGELEIANKDADEAIRLHPSAAAFATRGAPPACRIWRDVTVRRDSGYRPCPPPSAEESMLESIPRNQPGRSLPEKEGRKAERPRQPGSEHRTVQLSANRSSKRGSARISRSRTASISVAVVCSFGNNTLNLSLVKAKNAGC